MKSSAWEDQTEVNIREWAGRRKQNRLRILRSNEKTASSERWGWPPVEGTVCLKESATASPTRAATRILILITEP